MPLCVVHTYDATQLYSSVKSHRRPRRELAIGISPYATVQFWIYCGYRQEQFGAVLYHGHI